MTYLELITQLAQIAHRGDLSAQMYNFVQAATEQINRRLTLELVPLVADADTNDILTKWPLLYQYAGMAALYEFTNDGDNVTFYLQRFWDECDSQNITAPGTEPLYMRGV